MWTFNGIPIQSIKKNYGVELKETWIEHVQKSCLRVSLGGSASFVSHQGLVLTNHHVGAKAIYNLSKEGQDLMEKGFLASRFEEEIPCPNMYVDQLISIQDVTAEVNATSSEEMTPAERETARKVAMAEIKQAAKEATGLQPEIVSLYQGARYNLYLYHRYSDVRLVMAPEKSIAFFGGDTDNFEYPRYDLDICFFRVYENGKPLETSHFLKWSDLGPQPKEPLFVAGHPGRTRRMLTSAHLDFLKDQEISLIYAWLQQRRKDFQNFAQISAENKRIVAQDLFSCENSLKVMKSLDQGLNETPIVANKQKEEEALWVKVDNAPWIELEEALQQAKPFYSSFLVLEGAGSAYSKLYQWAKHLVRLSAERSKPNEERLKEYVDSELQTLELDLFSTEPVYKNLETVLLTGSFARTIQVLGEEHPASQILLSAHIDELLAKTRLGELEVRKELYEHPERIRESTDPLIVLAQALDPYSREIRQEKEDKLDSVQNESYAKIAKILFDLYGESVYPDATFTLRLSVGSMKGYKENSHFIDPMTTLGGTFEHAKVHNFEEPYDLPKSWLAKQSAVKKDVPFNFVSTNDIIGGNSGSPVINKKGELVGLIFDGNIHSIIWSFGFSDLQGRATSVHSRGILEALKNIYGADTLVREIQKRK